MTSPGSLTAPGPAFGRVRGKRFAAIFIPAFLAIAIMLFIAAQGALGVSFMISGQPFTVKASSLTGTGFEQFGGADADANGTLHPVFVSTFDSADLSDLCQSVSTPFPGPFAFLKIQAGGGGTPAHAVNLAVDATNLAASSATFTNIKIGQDPTTMPNPGPPQTKGTFGQSADSASISNVNQTALATSAGTFTLPGLNLGFASGGC